MTFIHFSNVSPDEAALPDDAPDYLKRGRDYVIWDDGLDPAVNAALLLGKPLLLTGEPGTGKTTLADRISLKRDLGEPLVFLTKSSSVATDLFYTYDALGRLHAAYSRRDETHDSSAAEFISFNALGLAFLFSTHPESLPEPVRRFRGDGPPRQSIVVVDEVDKANRDFPNDLLFEFDRLEFRIPELGNVVVKANREKQFEPILVVTSNSEKSLPDAFLRRCVYHHLSFPDNPETLRRIVVPQVERRVRERFRPNGPFVDDCFEFFRTLRDARMLKTPATGELVDWVTLLVHFGADTSKPLRESPKAFAQSLHALAKFEEDFTKVREAMNRTVARTV